MNVSTTTGGVLRGVSVGWGVDVLRVYLWPDVPTPGLMCPIANRFLSLKGMDVWVSGLHNLGDFFPQATSPKLGKQTAANYPSLNTCTAAICMAGGAWPVER